MARILARQKAANMGREGERTDGFRIEAPLIEKFVNVVVNVF
jgi:hypothetical protein